MENGITWYVRPPAICNLQWLTQWLSCPDFCDLQHSAHYSLRCHQYDDSRGAHQLGQQQDVIQWYRIEVSAKQTRMPRHRGFFKQWYLVTSTLSYHDLHSHPVRSHADVLDQVLFFTNSWNAEHIVKVKLEHIGQSWAVKQNPRFTDAAENFWSVRSTEIPQSSFLLQQKSCSGDRYTYNWPSFSSDSSKNVLETFSKSYLLLCRST